MAWRTHQGPQPETTGKRDLNNNNNNSLASYHYMMYSYASPIMVNSYSAIVQAARRVRRGRLEGPGLSPVGFGSSPPDSGFTSDFALLRLLRGDFVPAS